MKLIPGTDIPVDQEMDAIHTWFGLSYANYLVLHRSILQSMPDDWQRRFVGCLRELNQACVDLPLPAEFQVRAKDSAGKFIEDLIPYYARGRTRIPLNREKSELDE